MACSSALSRFNRSVFAERIFEANESRLCKALEMFEQEPSRGRLLDVAAGSGVAAKQLSDQGWTVTALDISEELLDQIRQRGIEDVHRHDLSEERLPFEDSYFRAVFAGEIIEHLVETGRFLDEVHRVLEPRGVVVITTPNLASFENRVRLLFGLYPRWVEYDLADQGHVRSYTLRTLREHLAEHGFTVEQMTGNWVPVIPQRFLDDLTWPFLARTGGWLPGLSQGLIAKARR